MNTTRLFASALVVAALTGLVAGCGLTAGDAETATTVDKVPIANTEVCRTAAWIRERAPEGVCEDAPELDDNMSLRRMHEELEHRAR